MKYKFDFQSGVINLPLEAADHLKKATRERLAVLISVAAEPSMTAKKRAQTLALSESEVADAIAYWNALGVIRPDKSARDRADADDAETAANRPSASRRADDGGSEAAPEAAVAGGAKAAAKKKDAPPKGTNEPDRHAKGGAAKGAAAERVTALDNDTPHLTTPELTDAASDAENAQLLEYCQHLIGRVFNAAEAERIVSVRSYLGVSADFIALICKNLKDEGRLTVRALENTAIELHDRGIADRDALVGYFDRREKARSFESKVRSLYGLGSRALSSGEKKILEKWASLGIGGDMIEFAYELTVNATSNASLNYSDAIITKWAAEGVKTVDEAKKREEQYQSRTKSRATRAQSAKKPGNETISSFETDDFFERALRRSYGDDLYGELKKNGESGENGGDGK